MSAVLSFGGPEPVTVAEAKLSARVDTDALDADIEGLITAAREAAEHITGRCYREQTQRFELRDWPSADDALPVHAATACAFEYWTGTAWVAFASQYFDFAPGGIGGNGTALAPLPGTNCPGLGDRAIGPRVRIDLTAGPASVADVPEQVKLYIRATVAAWLRTPEALAGGTLTPNPLHARLLDAQKLYG